MDGHRVDATVEKDGELILEGLPFHAGDRVEIVILPKRDANGVNSRFPLRGKPVWYEQPFCPVANDDWESSR